MDASFNVYYTDLTPDAQQRLCERFKTSPEKENWGNAFPLFTLERYNIDEDA